MGSFIKIFDWRDIEELDFNFWYEHFLQVSIKQIKKLWMDRIHEKLLDKRVNLGILD